MMLAALVTVAALFTFWGTLRRWRLRRRLPQANHSGNWHLWLSWVLVLSALLCIFFGRRGEKNETPCIMFLLDCSESMRAPGRQGTRLDEGRSAITSLAKAFHGCEMALVTYAGSAFVDCPPTPDHAAFDAALQSAGPGKLYLPGSAPEQALRQGEQFEAAALVLISDGEMNPPDASSLAIWQSRRLPLAAVCCGEIGVPKEIPHGSGVFYDETTGRPALSTSTKYSLLQAAALSSAPFGGVLEAAANQESLLAFLRQYVDGGKNRNELTLQFAIILLYLSLCIEPIVRWKRSLGTALLICLGAAGAVGEAAEVVAPLPAPTNGALATLRAELQQPGLSPAVRARLHSNLSALLCACAQAEPEQAGRLASEAVFAARAALRLEPGLKAAASNLELAQRLLLQDGSSAETSKNHENLKSEAEPSQAISGNGNGNGQEQSDSKQDSRIGSWRELQEKKARRQLLAAPQGVKPW